MQLQHMKHRLLYNQRSRPLILTVGGLEVSTLDIELRPPSWVETVSVPTLPEAETYHNNQTNQTTTTPTHKPPLAPSGGTLKPACEA